MDRSVDQMVRRVDPVTLHVKTVNLENERCDVYMSTNKVHYPTALCSFPTTHMPCAHLPRTTEATISMAEGHRRIPFLTGRINPL